MLQKAEEGELEFSLVFNPTPKPDLLVVQELFRQPLQLIVPLNHPLTARVKDGEPVTLEDVSKEPLVIISQKFGSYKIIERVFAQKNLPLEPLVEMGSIEGLKEFVKSGIGVSVMPPVIISPTQLGQELVAIPIQEFSEEFSFAIVYRRYGTLSMAARGLIKAITSFTQSLT